MILDLPMPPSANRIWGMSAKKGGRVYLAPEYRKWKTACEALCLQMRWHKSAIKGPFAVWVTLDREQRAGDIDNRLKAVLDFLHRNGITDDDRHCEKIGAEWGEAPMGCRVLVQEWSGEPSCATSASGMETGRG